MKSFVIGYDLTIKWKLVPPEGSDFSISDYVVKLRYKTSRGCSDVSNISIPINEDGKTFSSIIWEFKGRDQFATGKYDLILTLFREGKVKCVAKYLNAFELTRKQLTKTTSCSVSISRAPALSNTLELCSTIEKWVFSSQSSGIKIYIPDEETIISQEQTKDKFILSVGRIKQSQVVGLEDSLKSVVKGITITHGEKKAEFSPNDDGKIDLQLGDSLSLDDDNKMILVWKEY